MFGSVGASAGGFDFMSFLPLILIFFIFYFLLIRPQQKKLKTHQAMLGALRKGDRVITSGGLIGTITKLVSDQEVQLEIAENTRVRIMRAMINDVISKGSPLGGETSQEPTPPLPQAKKPPANRSRKTKS